MPQAASGPFPGPFFAFLRALEKNNNRTWFEAHKDDYVREVRDPLLRFIANLAPKLKTISPHIVADPRPNGGSMFRIYRDVRFSKDKRPYKTAASAYFRHAAGKDVHAPGYYLHLGPKTVYMGAGIWQPDAGALAAIRNAIVESPAAYKRTSSSKAFRETMRPGGESLKRPPRGFDPDHPHAEAGSANFENDFLAGCRTAKPLMKFITGALDLEF